MKTKDDEGLKTGLSDDPSGPKQAQIIILPFGARSAADIPLPFIDGSFADKVIAILKGKEGLVEFTDDEYCVTRDLFLNLKINFKILLGIPGVDSPRSFLSEDHYDLLLSYANLSFAPENQEAKFIKQLRAGNEELGSDEDIAES